MSCTSRGVALSVDRKQSAFPFADAKLHRSLQAERPELNFPSPPIPPVSANQAIALHCIQKCHYLARSSRALLVCESISHEIQDVSRKMSANETLTCSPPNVALLRFWYVKERGLACESKKPRKRTYPE